MSDVVEVEVEEKKVEAAVAEGRFKSPLVGKSMDDKTDFKDWKSRFEKAGGKKALKNLIFELAELDLQGEEAEERAVILMELSYHTRQSELKDDRWEYDSVAEKRVEVAKKARNLLCQKILNEEGEVYGFSTPCWFRLIVSERVLPKIFWFFSNSDNVPRSNDKTHDSIVMRQFLKRFTRLPWRDDLDRKVVKTEHNQLLQKYRSDFVKLLFSLGEATSILAIWPSLSDEDTDILQSSALSFGKFEESYETIEEVAVWDSNDIRKNSATALILIKALRKENARGRAICSKAVAKRERLAEEVTANRERYDALRKALGLKDIPGFDRAAAIREMRAIERRAPRAMEELTEAIDEVNKLERHYRIR